MIAERNKRKKRKKKESEAQRMSKLRQEKAEEGRKIPEGEETGLCEGNAFVRETMKREK